MLKPLIKKLIKSIQKVTGGKRSNLHEPIFYGEEINLLKKCIKSNFVSTAGPQVEVFEKKLAKLTNSKYVIACVNGTAALHLSLKIINVDRNCEVLLPSLNFVASANAIKYCGAIPHFIDSDKKTLGINPEKLEKYLKNICLIKKKVCFNKKTKKKISALIAVHIFGHPCNIFKIKTICKKFGIVLIEDAAEGIGSFYHKKHVGTFGKIGVLSFNGNKTITTGGGGALITNEKKIAKQAKSLSTTSKLPHLWRYDYESIGYNYRLPNINSVIGIAQLNSLNKILKAKRNLFKKYKKELKKINEIDLFQEPKFCRSNYWLNTILLKQHSLRKRDFIINEINKKGIQIRPCWKLLHRLKHFSNCPSMNLDEAKKLETQIINLPSSPIYGDYR
jgi:aminotransferase in exopolysaccharide biosynthesis